MNFYAAVRADGRFNFYDLRRTRESVVVSDRDAEHGVRVARIEANVLESAPPDASWEKDLIAFVVQNPDGSFWNDTLSSTMIEAEQWWGLEAGRATKMAVLGFKTVALAFQVAA